jgi:hypothetical protein
MITIGADRFRSKAAASPEFGAGSGGNVNDDIPKRLDSIERAILGMETTILAVEKSIVEMRSKLDTVSTKLDTVLPHLATKAELEAMRADLIKWVVGAAVTGVALATVIATLASRVTWH